MMIAQKNSNTQNTIDNRSNGQRNGNYGDIKGYQSTKYTGSTHIIADVEEFKGKQMIVSYKTLYSGLF